MSDERRRDFERRLPHGDLEIQAHALQSRIRRGEFPLELVEVIAQLGDPVSREVLGTTRYVTSSLTELALDWRDMAPSRNPIVLNPILRKAAIKLCLEPLESELSVNLSSHLNYARHTVVALNEFLRTYDPEEAYDLITENNPNYDDCWFCAVTLTLIRMVLHAWQQADTGYTLQAHNSQFWTDFVVCFRHYSISPNIFRKRFVELVYYYADLRS